MLNVTNSSTIITSSYSKGLTWDLYLRISIASFGIIANLINMSVFLNRKLNDITYKYTLANSITNVVYLGVSLCGVFIYYCNKCPSSQAHLSAVLSIIFTFYLLDCLKFLHILLEIVISIRIYLILINKPQKMSSYKRVLILLVILSFVFFAQELFSFDIERRTNQNGDEVFVTKLSSFGVSTVGDCFFLVQFGVRILFAVFVLSAINILNVIEFRKRFRKGKYFKKYVPNNTTTNIPNNLEGN